MLPLVLHDGFIQLQRHSRTKVTDFRHNKEQAMKSETTTQTGAAADVIHAIHLRMIDADLLTRAVRRR
jgi:hypothetical protein